MIFYGWGSDAKKLGEGFFQICGRCNNLSRFVVLETCKKVTLYFVPIAKWQRKYFYVCPICSNGFQIPDKELAQRILSGAFRNPEIPEPSLTQALEHAMRT